MKGREVIGFEMCMVSLVYASLKVHGPMISKYLKIKAII